MNDSFPRDEIYFAMIRDALAVCKTYRPKFGQSSKSGLALENFHELYQEDSFYAWFGLDSSLVYAAHKAAGGITSVYRQIGIACERVFRQILMDELVLSAEQAKWSYTVPSTDGKRRHLALDGRIPVEELSDKVKRERISKWVVLAAQSIGVGARVSSALEGAVFEVRQGYKSKDSKRQNADIGNASNAYAASYLPVVVLMSNQIDDTVSERYARAQWILLRGTTSGTSLNSTYVFMRDVVGYDLAGFFHRNSGYIKEEVEVVLEALLT